MYFRNLKLTQWQQFESVDIDLHERLTVLTGANGSGKTSILQIFARHFGWNSVSLSTPKTSKATGLIKFFPWFYKGKDRLTESVNTIGSISYSNDAVSQLNIPNSDQAQYQIGIASQQPVKCFFIPSHRAVFQYQKLGNIPVNKKDKRSAFNEVFEINKQRSLNNSGGSTSLAMKNTLIGWAINGYGVSDGQKTIMQPDSEQTAAFEGFQEALKKILPKSLGFQALEIRNMEIVFVCNDGDDEFLLETASGGICALIDITWQIYMFSSKENSDFTVIIDEVENHLHPIMQRNVLQNLLDAFPSARFIVSTHSPLIVGSVKDSSVYVLKYNEQKKIESTRIDFLQAAKSATEILDEVLGVSFTMPIWVEDELNSIVDRYRKKSLTAEDFSTLRGELKALGLERMAPTAIEGIMDGKID